MLFTSSRALILFTAAVLVMPGCGGSATTTGAPSAPSSPNAVVITIASGNVSPKNVIVPAGSQITFVNNDTVDHLMYSDPHPEHTECPDINAVGFLTPGQSRQTGNLNVVRTCGFHDHGNPTVASLRGTITIQ